MDRVFPRFFLPPEPLAPEHGRFFLIFNYFALLALAIHGALVPIFIALDLTGLAAFNLLSVSLWTAAVALNRAGRPRCALAIAMFEVSTHAIVAVIWLGTAAGFHYYLLLTPPVLFVAPRLPTAAKLVLVAVTGMLFLGLDASGLLMTPLAPQEALTLHLLAYGNVGATFIALAALSYYYHRVATHAEADLRRANERLELLAHRDELTGLMNRRCMMEFIGAEAARSGRTERPYAVVLIDVDNFKAINDRYGHGAGDQVLSALAQTMSTAIRRTDRLARWGGEEFLLLLPETDREGALEVAEKIRTCTAASPVRFGQAELRVTLTLGVCVCHDTADHCIVSADHALYEGKRSGKNRTVLAGAE